MIDFIERIRGKSEKNKKPFDFVIKHETHSIKNGSAFMHGNAEPVSKSSEFDRIYALPRRSMYAYPDEKECLAMSQKYHRPGGSRVLRPIQAWALKEAAAFNGLVGAIPVGEGKTDISALAAEAMNCDTSALLVPAALKKKYFESEYPVLSKQYRLPNLAGHYLQYTDTKKTMWLISYHQLSRPESKDILWEVKPKLIICDEAHSLADPGATRTKRFLRYLEEFPDTKLIILSGTLTSNSIKQYAHLAKYALKDRSPVPRPSLNGDSPILEEWSLALDPAPVLAPPGELLKFCKPGEDVRSGFMRRKLETPGWISSKPGTRPAASLVFYKREVAIPPIVKQALKELRDKWVTPGEEYIQYAFEKAQKARQLSTGLFTRWIWPNNEPEEIIKEWKEARKEWSKEVRDKLQGLCQDGEDSVKLLEIAAENGTWESLTWERWRDIRHQAKPQTEAVWLDDFFVNDAIAWGKEHVGIIWYEHAALGRRIAELGGFQQYGAGSGQRLQDSEKGNRTVVASIDAIGTGWNLVQFCKNYITNLPSSGKMVEQLLGRTHRSTQKADEVEAHIALHTPEMWKSLDDAKGDAEYVKKTDNQEQKLLYGTWSF